MTGGHERLRDLVNPDRLTAIVDVGANPVDGSPPYADMLRRRLCTVVGFEPQAGPLAALLAAGGPLETYLPVTVGDGSKHMLNIAQASGMTSLLEPDESHLELFPGFREWGRIIERTEVDTKRLDDIADIEHMDFLKIDIQGAELMVFRGARRLLREAVALQTEVSFISLYKDQPSFGEIDCELRQLGFVPHAFVAINRRAIAPVIYDGDIYKGLNQLLEADIVYVRDFCNADHMTHEQLRHLALISHCVYGSSDLTCRCIDILGRRGLIDPGSVGKYLSFAHPPADAGNGGT